MLLALFAAFILIALVVWAVPKLLGAIGVPANVATVIYGEGFAVLFGMVCLIVLWLVGLLTGYAPLRLR
jgi:hypothetical protein